jgi:hypothetical protein
MHISHRNIASGTAILLFEVSVISDERVSVAGNSTSEVLENGRIVDNGKVINLRFRVLLVMLGQAFCLTTL